MGLSTVTYALLKNIVAEAISDVEKYDFSVVTELPVIGSKGIIYLMPPIDGTADTYDQYIYDGSWRKLPSAQINVTKLDYEVIHKS